MKEVFLEYSVIYKFIKNDKKIINRTLHALFNENEQIDFDCFNNFYRILIFKNSLLEEKVTFIAKFIRYKANRLTITQILDILTLLTSD